MCAVPSARRLVVAEYGPVGQSCRRLKAAMRHGSGPPTSVREFHEEPHVLTVALAVVAIPTVSRRTADMARSRGEAEAPTVSRGTGSSFMNASP